MVKKISVSGYDGFKSAVDDLQKSNVQVNIYFTGSKNENGVSWCPDCAAAEPVVDKVLEEHAGKDSIFMVVDVGDRAFWKDMQNPFRKDADAQVNVIPTLLRWKSPVRLDGDQCAKKSLLHMFFTEEAE